MKKQTGMKQKNAVIYPFCVSCLSLMCKIIVFCVCAADLSGCAAMFYDSCFSCPFFFFLLYVCGSVLFHRLLSLSMFLLCRVCVSPFFCFLQCVLLFLLNYSLARSCVLRMIICSSVCWMIALLFSSPAE